MERNSPIKVHSGVVFSLWAFSIILLTQALKLCVASGNLAAISSTVRCWLTHHMNKEKEKVQSSCELTAGIKPWTAPSALHWINLNWCFSKLTFNIWNIMLYNIIINVVTLFLYTSVWNLELWPKMYFASSIWLVNSNQFILESNWVFVPNLNKFSQGIPAKSHSQEWDRWCHCEIERNNSNTKVFMSWIGRWLA